MALIYGIAALALLLVLARLYSTLDAHQLVRVLRIGGGVAALAVAAYLAVTGRFFAAVPLAYFGATLLNWIPSAASLGARMRRTPGQVSRVRSPFVEMELDHDSGDMRGTILAGQYEDVPLDALDRATLLGLLEASSTLRAARYSKLISTAGSPAGVNTSRKMRVRGARAAARRPDDRGRGAADPRS